MRIATWNLMRPQKGSQRYSDLLEYIRDINPDVWVLTETEKTFFPGPEFNLVAESGGPHRIEPPSRPG